MLLNFGFPCANLTGSFLTSSVTQELSIALNQVPFAANDVVVEGRDVVLLVLLGPLVSLNLQE